MTYLNDSSPPLCMSCRSARARSFSTSSGAINEVVGGWQLANIMTFAHGTPWSVGTLGDTMNIGGSQTPDATGISPIPAHQTAQQYWNVAAFNSTNPLLSYQFGNVRRNTSLRRDCGTWISR